MAQLSANQARFFLDMCQQNISTAAELVRSTAVSPQPARPQGEFDHALAQRYKSQQAEHSYTQYKIEAAEWLRLGLRGQEGSNIHYFEDVQRRYSKLENGKINDKIKARKAMTIRRQRCPAIVRDDTSMGPVLLVIKAGARRYVVRGDNPMLTIQQALRHNRISLKPAWQLHTVNNEIVPNSAVCSAVKGHVLYAY